jgi:hypothetical protein
MMWKLSIPNRRRAAEAVRSAGEVSNPDLLYFQSSQKTCEFWKGSYFSKLNYRRSNTSIANEDRQFQRRPVHQTNPTPPVRTRPQSRSVRGGRIFWA